MTGLRPSRFAPMVACLSVMVACASHELAEEPQEQAPDTASDVVEDLPTNRPDGDDVLDIQPSEDPAVDADAAADASDDAIMDSQPQDAHEDSDPGDLPLDTPTDEDSGDGDTAVEPLPALQWETVGEFDLTDGVTTGIRVSLEDPSARYVAVRALPTSPAPNGVCFQADDVRTDTQVWVPAFESSPTFGFICGDCRMPAQFGHDEGTWLFPGDGVVLDSLSELHLRVRARDCRDFTAATESTHPGLPSALEIQVGTAGPQEEVGAALQVDVGIFPGTLPHGSTEWRLRLEEALAVAAAHYGRADLAVEWRVVELAVPAPNPQRFAPGEVDSLNGTYRRAIAELGDGGAALLVINCMVGTQPGADREAVLAGWVPRIPGGLSSGASADAVFIQGELCAGDGIPSFWESSGRLGALIAHELGHFLGLHHAHETHGLAVLDGANPDTNLMSAGVLGVSEPSELLLTDRQQRVVHAHPSVQVPAARP